MTERLCQSALDALVDLVGPDSWRLSTEVKKLAAHANGGPITAADVNTLIASKLDDDIFKLTYALGRGIDYPDEPAVRKIVREAASSEYRWSSLIVGVVHSAPFQMRKSGEPATVAGLR